MTFFACNIIETWLMYFYYVTYTLFVSLENFL